MAQLGAALRLLLVSTPGREDQGWAHFHTSWKGVDLTTHSNTLIAMKSRGSIAEDLDHRDLTSGPSIAPPNTKDLIKPSLQKKKCRFLTVCSEDQMKSWLAALVLRLCSREE